MQACTLTASNIACRRGDRLLFAGVDFTLAGGEALHLAGPNGIGKSSLMRIIAGLLRPLEGEVTRDGAAALLDDRPALDEYRTLGEALDFWAKVDGSRPDAATFGLEELMDVPVRFLSTGQRKRGALARMAGQQAPIWLLDEPLNGLDKDAVGIVETLVADHCKAGGIAVIASHQPFALESMTRLELPEFAA
ncbi:heme ABC exporter ATP-binding protein CcmA [Altererythrobacter sp. ZODW24]|uniref:heme ABC exporter ATP-binding protein CcmA n=1 Tax=Altererythrobacter sp. ZODW24 TaxID=2185142 RepID=UPI000DF8601D|nr:heme ABC exporter ATP-binding protein CcmA [Altererythrobacter sp. ZODW24]